MSQSERDATARIEPGVTPIVVIGDDWGRHVSTQQHLFRRLLSQQPVIWVNSFGHRRPKLNLYDISRAVQKVARAAMRAFGADGVTVIQYNEAPAGQSVFHLHVHVIPRFDGVALKPHSGKMEDQAVLAANAEKIRKALASDPPH